MTGVGVILRLFLNLHSIDDIIIKTKIDRRSCTMTEFEVERIKQVFSVLKKQKLKEYEDQVQRCDKPQVLTRSLNTYMATLNEVKSLLNRYGLLSAGEPRTQEQLDDSEREHMYRFNVKYKAYAPEEYSDWDFEENMIQTGYTAEEAKGYLEEHLRFEYCNDKTFRDLQLELIDQFY
jgi:hypothetical protein